MKVKLLITSILSVCLIGCFASTEIEKKKNDSESVDDSTMNIRKAALLNVEMGETYLSHGQIPRAKQKFIHALELSPKLPEAHTSIGYFYERVGDLNEAEHHYKQAINFSESKGRFYNNFGTFLFRQGRYKEADKAFNNAIKDKQYIKTAETYENAGLCALKQADATKAYEYFETALKRDPNLYKSSLELAALEVQKNNFVSAKHYIDHYKSIIDSSSRSLWLEIQVNNKLGNKNEASSAAMKLKSKFPNSEEYKAYLGSKIHG